MTEEIFDVVNKHDEVIGQAPRPEVHAKNLLHRAVSIFVVHPDGRLLLQRRSGSKDQFPHCYTSSASGHVDSGEDYTTAAVRELREELTLQTPLEYLGKFPAGPETAFEFTALYQTVAEHVPAFDPDEIDSVEFVDLETIRSRVASTPEQFTPPFRVLFEWYVKRLKGEQRS